MGLYEDNGVSLPFPWQFVLLLLLHLVFNILFVARKDIWSAIRSEFVVCCSF
jgi:hypothetical protein